MQQFYSVQFFCSLSDAELMDFPHNEGISNEVQL
jgi:hypothetical protein